MVLSGIALLGLLSLSAGDFGPFGNDQHPPVGKLASIPGMGVWEKQPRLLGEVSVDEARSHVARRAGGTNPLYLAFIMYKYFISSADGDRCQHYPTCSHYGVLAVHKHGLLGILMTIDRLWQSGQPTAVRPYPVVRIFGKPRNYDPVDASDFWFDGQEQ